MNWVGREYYLERVNEKVLSLKVTFLLRHERKKKSAMHRMMAGQESV